MVALECVPCGGMGEGDRWGRGGGDGGVDGDGDAIADGAVEGGFAPEPAGGGRGRTDL